MTDNQHTCCVCGKPATQRHMSMTGQIPFWVCDEHHRTTYSALGYDENAQMLRMGLMDRKTNKWIDLKSLSK